MPIKTSVSTEEPQRHTRYVHRPRPWSEIKLRYLLRYLRKHWMHSLVGDAQNEVAYIGLSNPMLFSSPVKHRMLVFQDDLRKVGKWKKLGLSEIACRIDGLRNQVEANGLTRFVIMAAPDKLTSYAEFIEDRTLRDLSALPQLARQLDDKLPRLDLRLMSAIRHGEQDVYLPDDTHWGSVGHQIVATTLLEFLADD